MAEGEHTIRRLAAILAADVVGYSKMMGADEAGTLSSLKRHRDAVFNPAVTAHRGRVVKLIGDGTLVEFASVVDAVNCAVAIQRAVKAEGSDAIRLRIGVNLGDVIIEGDDIYGDGVNVAARLEPLAETGGVCIASIVNESVGNRIEVKFRDGGEVSVKNIERPVRVWKWHPDTEPAAAPAVAGSPDGAAIARAESQPEPPSVAVLPFDNMSGDPEQEYFSDGMTEDLITDLSKVAGLMVIARNSSFAYKKRAVDIRTVGRELGVRSVLEGSIRRAGNRIRINAQLIDAASGAHLWAERYDRDLTDIFEVQDEVTRHIVAALKVKLTPAESARIADTPTQNLEAHALFLQGRALAMSQTMNREMFRRTQDTLSRAIELDPNMAQAYAGLALTHMFDFHNRWSDDPDSAIRKGIDLAAKAMALDPNDSFGYVAAGVMAMNLRDTERARTMLDKALALNPNDVYGISNRGTQAIFSGRPAEGLPYIERAMRLDPGFTQQYLHWLGLAHLLLGHYETAATLFRERIRLNPGTDSSRAMLAASLGHLGAFEEAREAWAGVKAVTPDYDIAARLARLPFVRPSDPESIAAGLAKAGLPD
jgi:adenylate cyclase